MFWGTGTGVIMPPYVVTNPNTCGRPGAGGHPGCRCNRTKSGWFDMAIFLDWFFSTLLPRLKKQPGVKVVIEDNLSSHINLEVLKSCKESNIRFVCRPPNSTHLTKPLDITYYGPMKKKWRRILTTWKKKQSITNLPKNQFPALLKTLIDHLYVDKKNNMISGFKKTGIIIIPLDRTKVLDLPQKDISSPLKHW